MISSAVSRYGASVVQPGPTKPPDGRAEGGEQPGVGEGPPAREGVVMRRSLISQRGRAHHRLTDLKVWRKPPGRADSNDGFHAERRQLFDHDGGDGVTHREKGETQSGESSNTAPAGPEISSSAFRCGLVERDTLPAQHDGRRWCLDKAAQARTIGEDLVRRHERAAQVLRFEVGD